MSYYIALDPALHMDARDLAAAWNATPACRQLASAELVEMTPKGFPLDPQLVQQGLILLAGFAAGASTLALEALKDALKEKLTEYFKEKLAPKQPPALKVEFVRQPDGGLLIVTGGEG